jgi:translation initiation factor IF-2
VDVFTHRVIYHTIDEVRRLLGSNETKLMDQIVGEAQVLKLFQIRMDKGKTLLVAGCKVNSGNIHRNSMIQVYRDDQIIYTGSITSLKILKEDVDVVQKNHECGLSLDNFDTILPRDIIKAIKRVPLVQ